MGSKKKRTRFIRQMQWTTFEKAYKEPSIVLYVNKSLEPSDEITRMIFKILKRPPEDVVIRQLSEENESDINAENNNNKNIIVADNNDCQKNRNIGDNNGNEDDRENGSSSNKKYENNGKEDGGDDGDGPNETNGVNLNGFIKASASANIKFEEIIQKVTMQFILRMKHPDNKSDRLDIIVTDISISGGRMLSSQSKPIKVIGVIGYYPIEVQVSFTAISKFLEDKDSNLINFANEYTPIQNISTQTHTKTEIISEMNVPIVTITTVESGGTRFLWEHALNNKEKKIPGYSAPTHKADFEYEKVLAKEFEIKMELVLASEFKRRFLKSRVNKLPEKLRFSLSITIKEDKIHEIFKGNSETKCTHRDPLKANESEWFQR
ncbi:13316_t:CDS:2 [Acaulospora morrowiae]|uniref:13316_t:CDS:1 n=1 Tax=Acaulospora morrowiae TaxID=94023 RepID=A0A9N9GQE6_9GLOM|nr:13316_t:CDS:2 [Acaulospora morrowiae]